jgi:GNAT superfamily N-acetyltransferase
MVQAELVVSPEVTARDRKEFIELPFRLYRGDPVWVPPLRMAEADLGNPKKNPFFEHAEVAHFLARRGDRVVGRVAAIENRRHNEVHGERVGFFGRFDCESDSEAVSALVATARAWVAARGLTAMRGPVSYSTNDVTGVLVGGFDWRPSIAMPYNREDYDALLRGAGLTPCKDLLAYWIPSDRAVPERIIRIGDRVLERGGYRLRSIDLKRWDAEIDTLLSLYNRCWELNWGFVPMTEAEFRHAAKDLKLAVDPRIFLLVERTDGTPVGFVGAIPDLNEAMVGLDGRLFPFGLIKLLWRKRRIRRARVMLLGILPEVRGRGVNAALMSQVFSRAVAAGYAGGEGSWILENNVRMRHDLEALGGSIVATYRLYESAVAPNS